MRVVAVTGATGFVGSQVVAVLRSIPGLRVLAVGRDHNRLRALGTDYLVHDLNQEAPDCYELFGRPEVLIHLAWEGLPNYHAPFHLERNLMHNYRFLKAMLEGGLPSLTVAGTCYEYGLLSGCLTEDTPPAPTTCYGAAKDALRRFLELALPEGRSLRWARLFFMHGPGQNPQALVPQLHRAVQGGADHFDMSGGEQLRDYLPVAKAAELVVQVALQRQLDGVFNICSGTPISVRRLVEQQLAELGAKLALNLGVYPYPVHEPMAYWGDTTRLTRAVAAYHGGSQHE